MLLFTLATLIPLPLFALGAVLGGVWALAALIYMTLFVFLLDEFIEHVGDAAPEGSEFPAADRLSVALGGAHFALLILAIAALSGGTGLGWGARVALFFSFGMFFGQVSNSNAHELIHRGDRRLFRLGMWVYISLLFGHHTSAHRHIHHRFVATPDDPNSAAMGESFYSFAPRAWWGSFRAGAEMESALRKQAGRKAGLHPYVFYVGGALVWLVAVTVLFGAGGLVAYLGLAAYAQMQLLLSDYVQHYGLERRRLPGGRLEPVDAAHSWNATHWYSSALMLNAPRHSDHHAHPARPYPALILPPPEEAPRLPFSLPVMGAIALVPPTWFRLMDKRARRWQARAAARPGTEAGTEAEPEVETDTVEAPVSAAADGPAPELAAVADLGPAPAESTAPAPTAPAPTAPLAAPGARAGRPQELGTVAQATLATAPSDDEISAAVARTFAYAEAADAAEPRPAPPDARAEAGNASPRRRFWPFGRG